MRMLQRYPTPSPATVVHATERERLAGRRRARRGARPYPLAYDAAMVGGRRARRGRGRAP